VENYPSGCTLTDPAWHAPKILRKAQAALQSATAPIPAPDLGTEKLLRDMLDRAYKIMLMAGYRVAVVDSDSNDPIIAWMSDAIAVLYGSGPQPDLARLT
jgi:hypothetical protein